MLAFLINNTPLALNTETSVRITWANSACYFDSIPGDVAMGIDIPVNEVNRALLGNPERFEKRSSSSSREIPGFEIRFGGYLFLAGTLVIQTANKDSYSGWCRSNVGNLGKEHREKFIYDIPAFNENITFVNKANYDPDADDYGCPEVYNSDFFRDKGKRDKFYRQIANPNWYWGSDEPLFIDDQWETELLTKAFLENANWTVNKHYSSNPPSPLSSQVILANDYMPVADLYKFPITVVSPMLFIGYVIKTLLADAKFYVVNNAITDSADMKKLLLYNNYDITHMSFSTLLTSIETPYFNNTGPISYGQYVDYVFRNYTATFKYRDLLPKVKLKDFMLGIQNMLNVCFHFLPNGKVNIIDRENIIATTPIDINDYMVGEWEIGEKKDVTLKFSFTHDDDDVLFQEQWEDVDDRRPDEKEPVLNTTALDQIVSPTIGEMRYVITPGIYMEYAWYQKTEISPFTGEEITTDMLGWKHLANNFQNGFFNTKKEEQEEIKTVFSTLLFNSWSLYPVTQQTGNIKSIKFAYAKFTPRLLFYLGNNTAKHETANLSLDWEKDAIGLIAKRWPKWARFWCQRLPVSCEAALPLNMLDYVTRNITNKFRARAGEFIIETLETEFRLNSIGTTKITGYKSEYIPTIYDLTQHWAPGNLVLMDEIIDFTGFDNMNFHL
jgi:hypothetical protein